MKKIIVLFYLTKKDNLDNETNEGLQSIVIEADCGINCICELANKFDIKLPEKNIPTFEWVVWKIHNKRKIDITIPVILDTEGNILYDLLLIDKTNSK
jgi:hypothetical protein